MEDQNTVNEPAIPYGQPLDFQQVWLMFQETSLEQVSGHPINRGLFQK